MEHLDENRLSSWLFLPDYMIMQRLTEGHLKGNTYKVFFLKYLIWFAIGTMAILASVAIFDKLEWWLVLVAVAVDVVFALIYAAFSYRHVKENVYFKRKYGQKKQ